MNSQESKAVAPITQTLAQLQPYKILDHNELTVSLLAQPQIQAELLKILDRNEMMVLNNIYNSRCVSELTDDDFLHFMIGLLSEISMLVGAKVYVDTDYEKQQAINGALIELIKRVILTSKNFNKLTIDEIKHAFYLNVSGEFVNEGINEEVIVLYNKVINVEYISAVLNAYCSYKKFSAGKIEKINAILYPNKKVKVVTKITIDDYKRMIAVDFENYKNGKKDFIFMIEPKYLALRKLKKIFFKDKGSWQKWFVFGIKFYIAELQSTYHESINDLRTKNKILVRLNYALENGVDTISPDLHKLIIIRMRKCLYFEFFDRLVANKKELNLN